MKKGSIYQLEGRVPLGQAVPLGNKQIFDKVFGELFPLYLILWVFTIPLLTKKMLHTKF